MSDKDGRSGGPREKVAALVGRGGRDRVPKVSHQNRVDDSELREKDQTIQRLNYQLEKTAEEVRRLKEHSKSQSKRINELLSSPQGSKSQARSYTSSLEEENAHLQASIERLGTQIATLKRDKEELTSEVAIAKATANVYKEDFDKERKDRERAAEKIESLKRDEEETAKKWMETLTKKLEQAHDERTELYGELRKAQEEVQAKSSQVKQYKKRVDSLQKEVEDAQEHMQVMATEMGALQQQLNGARDTVKEHMVQALQQQVSVTEADKNQYMESQQHWVMLDPPISTQSTTKKESTSRPRFGKKKEDATFQKAEKARMKAEKKEREKKMKEEKEKRKQEMASMDEKKQRQYLEKEISRLEDDNLRLKNQLMCAEATCKVLVDKLDQTEAEVVKCLSPTESAHNQSLQTEVSTSNRHTDRHQMERYVGIQPLLVDDGQRERQDHGKPLPQQQKVRQKPATGPQHVSSHTTSSGASQHEHLHKRFRRQSSSDTNLPKVTPKSPTDVDYANIDTLVLPVPPASHKSPGSAQSPVSGIPKPPKPTPRAASTDAGRGGPLLPIHQTPRATTSMPEPRHLTHTTHHKLNQDRDISDMIDVDIHNEAAEVVATGRDERRYTLTAIPFDPFLECLYCNQKFRYGEIQKYRKHVNNCSGSAA